MATRLPKTWQHAYFEDVATRLLKTWQHAYRRRGNTPTEDVATRLPTLQKEDEGALLGKMLEELNIKFALQLDLKPLTDRSGQEASDLHDPNDMLNVVFAGGSHSSCILDSVQDESVRILDSTVPGFRLTERATAEMAADIAEVCAELCVVVCQLHLLWS